MAATVFADRGAMEYKHRGFFIDFQVPKCFLNNRPVLKIPINKDKTLYNQCLSLNTDSIRKKRFQHALPREPVEVLSWCKQVYHSLKISKAIHK